MFSSPKSPKYLTQHDASELIKLREVYVDAIIERAKNPANFEQNIECLKRLDFVASSMLKIAESACDKIEKSFNGSHEDYSFSYRLKYKKDIKKEYTSDSTHESVAQKLLGKMLKEAMDTLLTPAVSEQIKNSFINSNEPRIVSLNANQNWREKETCYNDTVKTEKSEEMEYKINFSDNFSLVFHSLTDEKVLAEIRESFENKMQELAAPRVAFGR